MISFFFKVALFFFFEGVVLQHVVTPGFTLYSNLSVPNQDSYIWNLANTGNGPFRIYSIPCSGAFNWYVGFFPSLNSQNSNCSFSWTNQESKQSCTLFFPTNGSIIYEQSDAVTTPSTMDIIVLISVQSPSTYFPTPGNGGTLQTNNPDSSNPVLSVTWTTTGNPNDVYSVYGYNGGVSNGNYPYTACGVRNYMTFLNVTQTTSGNTISVNINLTQLGYNVKGPYTIVVVVDRPNGYSSVYNPIINSASIMFPSVVFLLFIILSLIF